MLHALLFPLFYYTTAYEYFHKQTPKEDQMDLGRFVGSRYPFDDYSLFGDYEILINPHYLDQ